MSPTGVPRVERALRAVTSVPRALLGSAVVRIGIGVAQLSLYLVDYTDRRLLYGPHGLFPRSSIDAENSFNLYLVAPASTPWFELVFHAGILSCLAMILGLVGRAAIAAVWVTGWSLWGANPLLVDGGDNIAMVVLPMLFMTTCSRELSLQRFWRERCAKTPTAMPWPVTLLHNAGVLGIALQICLVYFLSGMYKAQGDMWVDGTALYYIMMVPEYFYPPLTPLLLQNDVLIVAGTYLSMIALIAFPFLVLSPRLRPWAVVCMLGFHLSIAVLMGLTSFAITMAACDCIFVSAHIERWGRRLREARVVRGRRPPRELVRHGSTRPSGGTLAPRQHHGPT